MASPGNMILMNFLHYQNDGVLFCQTYSLAGSFMSILRWIKHYVPS